MDEKVVEAVVDRIRPLVHAGLASCEEIARAAIEAYERAIGLDDPVYCTHGTDFLARPIRAIDS